MGLYWQGQGRSVPIWVKEAGGVLFGEGCWAVALL